MEKTKSSKITGKKSLISNFISENFVWKKIIASFFKSLICKIPLIMKTLSPSLWSLFKSSKVFWSWFETFKNLESYNLKILDYIIIVCCRLHNCR